MDNIEDDYLTNLSWLKVSNSSELQPTVECSNNHIDDDLQCLCWLIKIRPTSDSSHSLKRLSATTNKVNHSRNTNRSLSSTYVCDRSLNANDNSTSRRVLMVRTLNNHLSSTKSSQQSFIFIRSSTGQISCLAIHHFA